MTTEAGRRLLEREAFNSRSFPIVIPEAIAAIEAEARAAALADLEETIYRSLGHDLRELAQDAEQALHCIWPTMMLRVLDLIRKAKA